MITSKITGWKSDLENITKEYVSSFSTLDNALLNTKPNAQTWSIAQVLDHVIKVNETYYPVIRQVRTGNYQVPSLGRIGFMHRMFGNMILKSVEPTNKRKTKTLSIWQPSTSNIPEGIVQRFEQHQKDLAAFISDCEDLLENNQLISSPANRNIVYTLEKAFEIIVTHEKRHLNQAREILSAISKG